MPRLLATGLSVLGLFLGTTLPTAALAQSAAAPITLSDTVAFDRTGTVEIDNQTGSITVTTWDQAQVGYEVALEPNEGDSALVSEAYVHHTDQVFSFGLGDSWSIEIPGFLTISPTGSDPPTTHYRVTMPKTAELEIDGHSSRIDVSGLTANVEIDTFDGKVTVDGIEGFLELETFSGPVEATGLRGGASLDSHSGRISASFEEFSAPSEADSHSGPLRLFLPVDAGFELHLDVDEEDLVVDDAFGTPSSNEERRTYNGGGPPFQIDSFSGQVEVRPLASRNASSP